MNKLLLILGLTLPLTTIASPPVSSLTCYNIAQELAETIARLNGEGTINLEVGKDISKRFHETHTQYFSYIGKSDNSDILGQNYDVIVSYSPLNKKRCTIHEITMGFTK